jgi:hypothetical protein
MSPHFLSRTAQSLTRRLIAAAQAPAFDTDPIDHPAIAAMDLRALADLPLAPPRPSAETPRAERPAPRRPSHSAAA